MLKVIGEYWAAVIFPLLLVFASLFIVKDWKNWRYYYPTILFTIGVSLVVSVLTYEHWLWYFHKALFIPNHTLNDLWINFTQFPLICFMFLSRYPYKSRWLMQAAYTSIWAVITSLIEGVFVILQCTTYHNGWNWGWSVLFWFVTFPTLRLHHSKPFFAWLVFVISAMLVIPYFHIPITQLK
ncbi:CBO0543 family protein [Paenibacillus allorhizosphaerae]|uniref:Uncharacterized protein n=1 Tax=Paenibacillus allorhizosphaerae TaxID=2849866 RepID=A0ABM8VD17_9BACL|nr:CBO0543 family protein [Paenibacillus allorhizosphaerae]CAG7626173.1 hypothetical protein PAECIP111802_01223 [Paenibacillus allorhizosphaerae]